MILAIDSTAGTSAAVVSEGRVLGFSSFDDPFGHAENIGRAVEDALEQAGIKGESITSVAINRGPASYTGLRVGMAAGVAFATARQIPLHGVVSLDAIANFHAQDITAGRLLVTSDAKRGELFVGVYLGFDDSGLPIRPEDPKVMKPVEVEESFQGVTRIDKASDAAAVGIYAEKAIRAGVDLSDTTALYLRSPDVTPSTGKRVSG
ncbi:MAG TPA: tRNA (adenosine(37)-N6)-threonylcarbamoyltransferase complex dimerization subunit type 1 TsaB [Microbacteriaceae bacterium]